MPLRFHEISESRHRILNPFTDAKLQLLGRICGNGLVGTLDLMRPSVKPDGLVVVGSVDDRRRLAVRQPCGARCRGVA